MGLERNGGCSVFAVGVRLSDADFGIGLGIRDHAPTSGGLLRGRVREMESENEPELLAFGIGSRPSDAESESPSDLGLGGSIDSGGNDLDPLPCPPS